MIRYAITDLSRAQTDSAGRLTALRQAARKWLQNDIDFVQLREKGLPAGEVLRLAEEFLAVRQRAGGTTRLLVNSRADIAAATGADGVHLTSAAGELTAEQVQRVFATAGRPKPIVSVSCHSLEDVERARAAGVDLILFGPVFEKVVAGALVGDGGGLALLARAAEAAGDVPVLALGGVTPANAAACAKAGAAGVAGIRFFAEGLHRVTTE